MKKTLFLFLLVGLLGLSGCNDLNNDSLKTIPIKTHELPKAAQITLDGIKDYIVVSSVRYTVTSDRGSLYETKMVSTIKMIAPPFEIEFDKDGIWTDVETEAEKGHFMIETIQCLPHFPSAIVRYIKNHDLRVEEIERTPYGFKVETIDDRDFYFNKLGIYLGDDD